MGMGSPGGAPAALGCFVQCRGAGLLVGGGDGEGCGHPCVAGTGPARSLVGPSPRHSVAPCPQAPTPPLCPLQPCSPRPRTT